MPGQLGLKAQPGVLGDQFAGCRPLRPSAISLMVKLCGLRRKRLDPVIQVTAERVLVQIISHGQGQVDRVGPQPDVGERLAAQCLEFPKTLTGDRVHRAGGQVS